MPVQADPSVKKRNDRDGISYADYFKQRAGIYLEPANNDIMYGIEKVRDYMDNGKLKFFSDLNNLRYAAMNYIYVKPNNKEKNTNDLPIDAFNHLWDAIRYIIVSLPRDPNKMNAVYVQNNMINETYNVFKEDKKENFKDDFYREEYYEVYEGFKL